MPYFDRFDICGAYLAVELDYNVHGWLQERPTNRRRRESTGIQLQRLGHKVSHVWRGFESLTPNGKEIYLLLCKRYGFVVSEEPETECDCRDAWEGGADRCQVHRL